MTPDIRPRPSPGSRIYSREETPPPKLEITQRAGVELKNRTRFDLWIIFPSTSLCWGSQLFLGKNCQRFKAALQWKLFPTQWGAWSFLMITQQWTPQLSLWVSSEPQHEQCSSWKSKHPPTMTATLREGPSVARGGSSVHLDQTVSKNLFFLNKKTETVSSSSPPSWCSSDQRLPSQPLPLTPPRL